MRTVLTITGAVVWGASALTLGGALVWKLTEQVHLRLKARREARMSLSDASLRRFVDQAAREGRA